MENVTHHPALVLTGTPLIVGVYRASLHTHRALDRAEAFFRWCSENPRALVGRLLESDHPARQQWRDLIVAQSMDMFADTGMNAVNWTATLIEALGQFSHLSSLGHHRVQLEGFDLDFQRIPGPEQHTVSSVVGLPSQSSSDLPVFVSLTMQDVERGLNEVGVHLEELAAQLSRLSPSATQVEHTMLASALLALQALGPMTGYSHALVGGPADPWHAVMTWALPGVLRPPSGDVVAVLDDNVI